MSSQFIGVQTFAHRQDGDLCTMEGLCPGLIPARPPRLKQQEKDLAFSTGIHKRRTCLSS